MREVGLRQLGALVALLMVLISSISALRKYAHSLSYKKNLLTSYNSYTLLSPCVRLFESAPSHVPKRWRLRFSPSSRDQHYRVFVSFAQSGE